MRQKYNDSSRYVRLTQIQYHLHKSRSGLTTRELADLCGATVRTVQRDLLVLQSDLHVPLSVRLRKSIAFTGCKSPDVAPIKGRGLNPCL